MERKGILEDLNEGQLEAVRHDTGPALVVAGAGTGKTRVITHRIAHLIEQKKAQPGEILALTFTEKAAREMAERLHDLIGWESFQVPVMTFNAFGAELLGRYAPHIGRSIRGGLINDTQKALLLQQHFEKVQLSYYGPQVDVFEFLEGVVEYIGRLQNSGITAERYQEYAVDLQKKPGDLHPKDVAEQQDLAALYTLYDQVKTETGTFDYHDQLQLPLQILQQKPNVAARLSKQFRYVLVDEYQDTNTVQDQLLRAFIPKDGNIFAVGDDDQAIYGFRGAQIDNILSFVDHFTGVTPLVLTENYRSGQEILDAAYRLIQHNDPERLEAKLNLDKHLVAATKISAEVNYIPYNVVNDEQEGVLEAIREQLNQGRTPSDIAVLAPTHAALQPIARGLRARSLPFALSTRVNIFEQPELNQLWYLLQWVGGKADDESIAHVLLSPWFSWSDRQYRELVRTGKADLAEVEELFLKTPDAKKLQEWRSWAAELPVSKLTYQLVFETGVSDRLIKATNKNTKTNRIVRVFEDLHRFLSHMQDYEVIEPSATLARYLQAFPKPPTLEVTEPLGDSEGVQLLTVHAAKGLEFDTVYLIGSTQRAWQRTTSRLGRYDIPEALQVVSELPPEHEQRRLMYVAATRAKQELIISSATKTASGTRQAVSPFVTELLPEALSQAPDTTKTDELEKALKKMQRFYPLQQQSAVTLPFETADGWLELGVNDLGNYEFCPYDFHLQKVLGIVQPFGPQLAFGNAVHGAIQRYYQAKLQGEPITEAELRARIDELWNNRGYESKALADQARDLAYQALHNFIARPERKTEHILGTELPIKLELPEAQLRLKGRIDAFYQVEGGVELRDFKTGRAQTDSEKLAAKAKSSFQLRTYALAQEIMTGKAPVAVTLDYVVTDTIGTAELSATILKNHRAKLVKLAERIRAGDFAPQNTTMHDCAAFKYFGTETELDDLVGGETDGE